MSANIIHANVHNPKVGKVWAHNSWEPDTFAVFLGNVTLFTTDDEWRAMVDEVTEKRAIMRAKHIREDAEATRCAECNRADQPTTMETDVCDECVATLTGTEK